MWWTGHHKAGGNSRLPASFLTCQHLFNDLETWGGAEETKRFSSKDVASTRYVTSDVVRSRYVTNTRDASCKPDDNDVGADDCLF